MPQTASTAPPKPRPTPPSRPALPGRAVRPEEALHADLVEAFSRIAQRRF